MASSDILHAMSFRDVNYELYMGTINANKARFTVNPCTTKILLLLLRTDNRNNSYYEFAEECIGSDFE